MPSQKVLRQSLWEPLGDMFHSVLEYLSQQDLVALSLVSKASRADVEPVLFEKVEWKWDRSQTPPIVTFLNIILRRPKLATHVKSVVLNGEYLGDAYEKYRGKETRISADGLDFDAAVDAIRATGVPYTDRWEQDLRDGKMDAFISLMLSQLPNLKSLVLGPCTSSPPGLLGMLFASALCNNGKYRLPTYARIRDVTYMVTAYDEAGGWRRERNTPDALPFFYLPELRSLSLGLDNPSTLQWPAHRPPLSALTSLQLSNVRETHLEDLLSTTRRLEKLRWKFWYTYYDATYKETVLVDLNKLGRALLPVYNTLEELIITAQTRYGGYQDYPEMKFQGTLKGLNDLPKLKTLRVPMLFLVHWSPGERIRLADVVPKHVQTITITDDLVYHEQNEWEERDLLDAVQLWLSSWRLTHGELKSLTLLFEEEWEWDSAPQEEFQSLCNKRGIQGKLIWVRHRYY